MWVDTFQSIINPITGSEHNDNIVAHHRLAPSRKNFFFLLPLFHLLSSSICPSEAVYSGIAPRHLRSDVCPGCLIQRLQKYSVREAATTQSPLPPMPSSPATSFTQFPLFPAFSSPVAPSFSDSHFCVHWVFMWLDPHISTRRRSGAHYFMLTDYSQGGTRRRRRETLLILEKLIRSL